MSKFLTERGRDIRFFWGSKPVPAMLPTEQWVMEEESESMDSSVRPWTAEIATVTDGGTKPKYNIPTRQGEVSQALDKTIQAAAASSQLSRSPMTKKNRELWAAQVDAQSFSPPPLGRPTANEDGMATQQAKVPFLQVCARLLSERDQQPPAGHPLRARAACLRRGTRRHSTQSLETSPYERA
jgi:hypothetical protein